MNILCVYFRMEMLTPLLCNPFYYNDLSQNMITISFCVEKVNFDEQRNAYIERMLLGK